MEQVPQGRVVTRRRGSRNGWWWLGAAVLSALACDRPTYTYDPDLPLMGGVGASPSGFGGVGAVTAGAASTGAAGSGATGAGCQLDRPAAAPTFSGSTVSNQLPARRVLYAQLTDAEVADLKATGRLLPPPSNPPKTAVLTSLLGQLAATATELRKPLLQELMKRFQVTRTTWPNPWALRLVEHPSSQRLNPVRITLKSDAWVVRIYDGSPAIVDVNNAIVSITAATAAPERIAAIYYVADDRSAGAVASCETGKRELALGNVDMVEEVAVGTEEILEQLNADVAALEAFFNVVRPCSTVGSSGTTYHSLTVCQSWRFFDASTEHLAYQWSLANPVEAYRPTAQNLATLIQALKDDRFEPEPLVVVPEPSVGVGGEGAGGEANAGGAAAGGAGGAASSE